MVVSIHVVGLPYPYGLPYESTSFVGFSINHIGVLPVYHMILIVNMICDCRFVADILAALVFSALVNIHVSDAVHFFTMFFCCCSQWPSCSREKQFGLPHELCVGYMCVCVSFCDVRVLVFGAFTYHNNLH